jgi:hypothetical protein
MSEKIVALHEITTGHIPPSRVIRAAEEALDEVVVIGRTHEGELYFAGSCADKYETLWLIEQAKKQLLEL